LENNDKAIKYQYYALEYIVESDSIYLFSEIVDRKKSGMWNLFGKIDSISTDAYHLIHYVNEEPIEYIGYYITKNDVRKINIGSLAENEKQFDTLSRNCTFWELFQYFINTKPSTLDYTFPILSQKINIVTSQDSSLRFYEGKMIYEMYKGNENFSTAGDIFSDIFTQYRSKDSIYCFGSFDYFIPKNLLSELNQYQLWIDNVSIDTLVLNGRNYYLVDISVYDRLSESEVDVVANTNGNVLRIYSIENGRLIKNNFFKWVGSFSYLCNSNSQIINQ
jgi:hypothetical protein